MSKKAVITNISRCSVHDGPGARTVVFFKGCGLRCRWCHNPETLDAKPEIMHIPSKCIHCGRCIDICPEHHVIVGNDMQYIREGCQACGKCALHCPTGALELCGKHMSVDEVFQEVVKDKHFYDATGGGITLSGGECLLYPDFAVSLLKKCKADGIHTAIETAAFVSTDAILQVIPYADLVYADLKIADPVKHQAYTGQSNKKIIDNLRTMSNVHGNMILRIPLIPQVNDTLGDMKAFSEMINTLGSGIQGVELLRYNNLASAKYAFVGRDYEAFGDASQEYEQVDSLCKELKEHITKSVDVFYRK